MRRSLVLAALTAVLATSGLSAVAVATPSESLPEPTRSADRPQVARGIIVKATTTSKARRNSIARTAAPELPGDVAVAATKAAPSGLTVVALDAVVPTEELGATLADVQARPDVEWAIPDTLRFAQSAPPVAVNDPFYPTQGNLWDTRTTIDGVATEGGFTTKAPALWRATKGSASVVVAVIDTGITTHPDLAGQTVGGYDFVDDEYTCVSASSCVYDGTYVNAGDGSGWDSNPADPGDWRTPSIVTSCFGSVDDPAHYVQDSSWHGTHVAGTVAARANNGIGVAGIAPGVKVQPVRVLGHCGGWDSDIYYGILWAAGEDLRRYGVPLNKTPAKVISLSLGAEYDAGQDDDGNGVLDRDDACAYYASAAGYAKSRGATVVASAGNASSTSIFPLQRSVPASCDGFLSVTATSDSGHRAWYSTTGPGADISAPGGDQHTGSYSPDRAILSTLNSGTKGPGSAGYARYQGTSMATPAVSAGAALLYSLGFTNPTTVEAKLKASVQPYSSVAYGATGVFGPSGLGFTTTAASTLNCNPLVTPTVNCGAGILDLSKVTAPLGGPWVTGGRTPGAALTATSRGLTNAGGTSAATWWRGSTKVSSGPAYRVTAADLGKTLVARDTVVSGTYAGAFLGTAVSVAKAKSAAKLSMPSKVKKSKKAKLKVTISAPYVSPTGTIKVYDGKRKIATKKLTAGAKGRVTITLPKLKKGTHRIKVVYSGSTQLTAATSKVRKVTSR